MSSKLITTKQVLARNVLLNWTAVVAEMVVAFFLTPFIVTSLGLVVYGIWGLLNSVIGYMGLVDLGIRGSVGRFLNAYIARGERRHVMEVVSTSIAILSVMSLLALVAATLVGANFLTFFSKTPPELLGEIRLALPMMAFGLWVAFLGAVYRTALAAHDRFDVINAVALLGLVLRTATTIIVLERGWGLIGLVGSNLAVGLVMNLAFATTARHHLAEVRFSLNAVSKARFDEMWRLGLVTFTGRTASTLVEQAAPVIAMTLIGPAAVGIYAIATQLTQMCQKLTEQLGIVIYPSVMKLGGVADLAGLRSVFRWYARLSLLVGTVLYVGVFVFAQPFLNLWVGNEFRSAVLVVQVLAIGDLLSLTGSTAGLSLFALGRLTANLYLSVVEALAIVALSTLLAGPLRMGLLGLALGTALPIIVTRAVVYPVLGCRVIQDNYAEYMLALSARLAVIVGLSGTAFWAIRTAFEPYRWISFLVAISAAAFVYALLAIPLMLAKPERDKVLGYIRDQLKRRPA